MGAIEDKFQVRQIGLSPGLCLCPPGVQLLPSSNVDVRTSGSESSITVKAAHKECEGVYTVRLRTGHHVQEHGAYVYVKGEGLVGTQCGVFVMPQRAVVPTLLRGLRTSALVLSSPSKHAEGDTEVTSVAGSRKHRVKKNVFPANRQGLRFSTGDEICSKAICCFPL